MFTGSNDGKMGGSWDAWNAYSPGIQQAAAHAIVFPECPGGEDVAKTPY
jgi:hypothetical protein